MKIGIATHNRALNAGAVLQAYALQKYLESLGHSVELIDIKRNYSWTYRHLISKSPIKCINKWRNHLNRLKYDKRSDEWTRCLKMSTSSYYSYNEIATSTPLYDLYITGSDQVWNFLRELNQIFLLEFVPGGKRKASYAASMGQCKVPKHLHGELYKQLSTFDFISLREKSGVEFVSELMGGTKDVFQTVDPTLLNKSEIYDAILEPTTERKYIASYILNEPDKEIYDLISYISKQIDAPILNLRNPDTCEYLYGRNNKIVTPYQWLSYIKYSDCVICGSFHAVAFSLIYHKPFIVPITAKQKLEGGNARINSLLEPLGLLDRCVSTIDEFDKISTNSIDWDKVDQDILVRSELSKKYIIKLVE